MVKGTPDVQIFDISQTLEEGMPVWPGDPEFRRKPAARIRDGEPANVLAIHMGTHTGTHIDAPLHVDDSGTDAVGIPVRHFIGPARVVQISTGASIKATGLASLDWKGVERVLFKTRSGSIPPKSFDPSFVWLTEDASEFLVGKGLLLVGTDAPSIDPFASTELSAHKMLIRGGVAILEGVRLDAVPPGDYSLVCLPLKIAGADGSPVRAILWR
jgi:arylformamidase